MKVIASVVDNTQVSFSVHGTVRASSAQAQPLAIQSNASRKGNGRSTGESASATLLFACCFVIMCSSLSTTGP